LRMGDTIVALVMVICLRTGAKNSDERIKQ
jgi:hypothetical protein